MQNNENTVDPTVVAFHFAKVEEAEAAIEAARKAYFDALLELRNIAGSTFVHNEQHYQIRVRGNEPFMTKLKGDPKEWLAASLEKRMESARKTWAAKAAAKQTGIAGEAKVIEETMKDEKAAETLEAPTVRTVGSDIVIE